MLFQYFQKCKESFHRIFVLKNLNIRQTRFTYLLKQTLGICLRFSHKNYILKNEVDGVPTPGNASILIKLSLKKFELKLPQSIEIIMQVYSCNYQTSTL